MNLPYLSKKTIILGVFFLAFLVTLEGAVLITLSKRREGKSVLRTIPSPTPIPTVSPDLMSQSTLRFEVKQEGVKFYRQLGEDQQTKKLVFVQGIIKNLTPEKLTIYFPPDGSSYELKKEEVVEVRRVKMNEKKEVFPEKISWEDLQEGWQVSYQVEQKALLVVPF